MIDYIYQGVHLSGIMAILFCGVVMSHYTHYNLSPVTQVAIYKRLFTFLNMTFYIFRGTVSVI